MIEMRRPRLMMLECTECQSTDSVYIFNICGEHICLCRECRIKLKEMLDGNDSEKFD